MAEQINKVYVVTKQLILPTTSTTPITIGVYDSFDKVTKNIGSEWKQLSNVQWGCQEKNVQYIITEHIVK